MERPDRGHGGDYDDFVLTRDLYTVMSAFGCQPVKYHVSDVYTTGVAHGSGIAADFFKLMSATGTAPDDENILRVNYDESGVISPMLASVKSVNEAVKIVKESNTYFGKTRDSAERDMAFGIWSSINAVSDIVSGVLGITDTAFSMAKDAKNITLSFTPPWFGVPAPAHGVALGLNAVSVNFQILSLAANATNLGLVLSNTIIAGQIAHRLGSDTTEMLSDFCDGLNNEEIKEQMEQSKGDSLNSLEEQKNTAKNEMDNAESELVKVENYIETCADYYEEIDQADNANLYHKFLDPKRQELFPALQEAEKELAEATKDLDMLIQTRDQTKLPDEENQKSIDDLIDQMREGLVDSGYSDEQIEETLASNKRNLEEKFKEKYDLAVIEIPLQQKIVEDLQRVVDEKRAALVAQLPDPELPPEPLRNNYPNEDAWKAAHTKWVLAYPSCVFANHSINTTNWKEKYDENYMSGYWIFSENDNNNKVSYSSCAYCSTCDYNNPLCGLVCPVWTRDNVEFNTFCGSIPNNGGARSRCLNQQPGGEAWKSMNEKQIIAYCDSTLYYDLWKKYDQARLQYEKAEEAHTEVLKQPVSVDTSSCNNLGGQEGIKQWTLDEALILLKQVDQRGALQ
jgi:hypothetical protein